MTHSPEVLPMDEVSGLDVTGAKNATESSVHTFVYCLMQGSFMEEETEEILRDE
jgi:hypothetical protein